MVNKQSGYTLIEILAVLGIIASITILTLQDKRGEIDQLRARHLGVELYEYNNAVRAYISTNPGIPFDPPAGNDWLKTNACGGNGAVDYLRCDFPDFTTLGDMEFDTDIVVDAQGYTVATTILGPLTMDNGNLRSDLTGLASISAAGGSLNIIAPIFASTNASYRSDVETAEITMEASTRPATDLWLRTDGSNMMNASITFNDTIPALNRGIVNLSFINAAAGEGITIDTRELLVTGSILADRMVATDANGPGINALNGSAGGAFDRADTNDFDSGDILAEGDLFVDERLIIGDVSNIDEWDTNLVNAGDVAVGGSIFLDDEIWINGVQLSAEQNAPTLYHGDVDMLTAGSPADPGFFEARAFYDSDDRDYFVDPDGDTFLNNEHVFIQQRFGGCNTGLNPFDDCLDYDYVEGLGAKRDRATPAMLEGFVNVDRLYVQKQFAFNENSLVDPITGSNNRKDYRWVSLHRLLPDFVMHSSYIIRRDASRPPTTVFRINKPWCGEDNDFTTDDNNANPGVPKILVIPVQIPLNINSGSPPPTDGQAVGGFTIRATDQGTFWNVSMYSLIFPTEGFDAAATVQTYCFYGERP